MADSTARVIQDDATSGLADETLRHLLVTMRQNSDSLHLLRDFLTEERRRLGENRRALHTARQLWRNRRRTPAPASFRTVRCTHVLHDAGDTPINEPASMAGGAPRFGLLDIRVEDATAVVVVVGTGEIDLATAQSLRHHILLSLDGGRPLIVDLTGVTYMDASGLRVLEECSIRMRKNGQRLVVVPSPLVDRILSVADLDGQLSCAPTLDLALRDFRTS